MDNLELIETKAQDITEGLRGEAGNIKKSLDLLSKKSSKIK